MRLAELQSLFWRAISWPTGIDDFLEHSDSATRDAFEATFAQTPAFGRRERMTVYAESYFWRLLDVLRDQLKVTSWLLGEQRFHNLVTDYLLRHPSTNPDIRRFGAGVPEFLRTHPAAHEVPGADELADVDWATVAALDAANGPVVDAQVLASIPLAAWPGLRLVPSVGLRLFRTRRPYADLWHAREQGEPSPEPPPEIDDDARHAVLVWRRGLEVLHRSVAPAEARALQSLVDGSPFSEICVAAAGPTGDDADAPAVVAWLRRWLAQGLVGAIASGG